MEKLNEVKQALKYLEIDAKAYADNFSASMIVSTKNILAIAEAFRALEQRASNLNDGWLNVIAERDEARAKLAELAKHPPIGRVERGAATDSNEYPDARVVCLHEHVGWEAFQDGCELFTRPAPAINLAELVPSIEALRAEFEEVERKSDDGFNLHRYDTVYADDETQERWDLWLSCRAAILRNIEEKSK